MAYNTTFVMSGVADFPIYFASDRGMILDFYPIINIPSPTTDVCRQYWGCADSYAVVKQYGSDKIILTTNDDAPLEVLLELSKDAPEVYGTYIIRPDDDNEFGKIGLIRNGQILDEKILEEVISYSNFDDDESLDYYYQDWDEDEDEF